MTMELRILRASDAAVLGRVADGVFDDAIQPALAREFLGDARHHLGVALDDGDPGEREHVMFEFRL